MASILKKAKNYKRIPPNPLSPPAYINDPFTVPPRILKQDPKLVPKN